MPRMWEITVLLFCLEAAIIFTNSTQLFTEQYYMADQGGTSFTSTDLRTQHEGFFGTIMDYVDMAIGFLVASITMLLTIMKILFLIPSLTETFHIPWMIGTVIQTMIYLEFIWFFAQWRSGRAGGIYE